MAEREPRYKKVSGQLSLATSKSSMPIVTLESLNVREIFPGLRARVVHTDRTSQSWVDIDPGATFPEHHHPHEQTVNVLEGTLELIVNGQLH
ncbi:MAG: cupin domain-containing protein, partial [Vicinamibacterales bacterium]